MARVLGRLRISKDRDSSSAIDSQRQDIQRWAELHDHEVVGWAEDRSVSGAIDPFKAPELSRWLNDEELADRWDILVGWKLDRLGRNLRDLLNLDAWCTEHRKSLACVKDDFDTSTPTGRLIFTILGAVAELERDAMRTRINREREAARLEDRYHGGATQYGYRPVKLPGKGWGFEVDPVQQAVVHRMVQLIESNSAAAVAAKLNEDGIPAPRGGRWSGDSVANVLRSRHLVGLVEYNGELVIGPDGAPIRRDPIIPRELFDRANAALDGRRRQRVRVHETQLLVGVVYCRDCDCQHRVKGKPCRNGCPGKAAMNSQIQRRPGGKIYKYYRCGSCRAAVRIDVLDKWVDETFRFGFGPIQEVRRERVAGGDPELIGALTDQANGLMQKAMTADPATRTELMAQATAVMARLDEERSKGDIWRSVPTGRTYGDIWDAADTAGRRTLLQHAGYRLLVSTKPEVVLETFVDPSGPLAEGPVVGR